MKLLWVLPRFGREITGGAETYTSLLMSQLQRRGHRSTVLATLSSRMVVLPGYEVQWPEDRTLARLDESDGILIERFPARGGSLPMNILAALLTPFESLCRRIFETRLRGSPGFPEGWWTPETWEGKDSVLWSSGDSTIQPPAGSEAVCLEILAPRPGAVELRPDGGPVTTRRLQARTWQPVRVQGDGGIRLRLRGRTWRHAGRSLAFAVRRVRAWKDGAPACVFEEAADVAPDPGRLVRETIGWGRRRWLLEELASRRFRGPSSPDLLDRLRALLPETDAVVAGYFPFTLAAEARRLCREGGRPFLLLPFAHANDATHHFRWQYELMRSADRVLALSHFNRTHFFEGVGARAAFLGGGPSHTCTPCSGDAVEALRRSLGLEPHDLVVLSVARKTAYKAYREVLDAVERVARESGLRLQLLWVGPDEDGQSVRSRHWIHAGRLSEEQLCKAYEASDIFCLHSASESFGMVVLDAWAHRLPVVVNALCGPTSELVEDGTNGLRADPRGLAPALRRLAEDAGLRRRLGEAGGSALRARHDWSASAARFEAVLTDVVGERAGLR